MSEADEETGVEAAVKPASRFLSRKKLLMFGLPVLVLLGGGAGAYATGYIGHGPGEAQEAPPPVVLYYDIPEMVVNLSAVDKRAQFLKMRIALETEERATLDALPVVMPRIQDTFQLYLRELRASDLDGSAGLFRLKEELLRRINMEIHPRRVTRVLFKEIIIQ